MTALHWLWAGLREALAMLWATWWPLVLGFSLSGLVQSMIPRDGLRSRLGSTSPSTVGLAAILGVVSSSCSYAASATARALFARGASLTNSLVFMLASTNLVIELGIVLYLFLGWQFVAAQFLGGVVMVALLGVLARAALPARLEAQMLERVTQSIPPSIAPAASTWRERIRDRGRYIAAARYTIGDATMLRKELGAGFLVAGYLTVHVPESWWGHLFWTGHGWLTAVENAVLAPLLAVVSFVCSVGNIPLAAALWVRGVSFGGVIAFIFADLVTLPLLLIYRRFYGTAAALRLFGLLWFVMSAGGLVVESIFSASHGVPGRQSMAAMSSHFEGGATLYLNVVATVFLVWWWWMSRRPVNDSSVATDPVCGMSVDKSAPAAVRHVGNDTIYFCSPRCAERFDAGDIGSEMHEDPDGDATDPICGMTVSSATALFADQDGVRTYFCSAGCRTTFLDGPPSTPLTLGKKPS